MQELTNDNAHTLFDGKEDQDTKNLKDMSERIDAEKQQIITKLKELKNDLLGEDGSYPDFIKTLAQQKRKATPGNPRGGIPAEIVKIWADTKNPKTPNLLLTKIDTYMQTNAFKQECIKDFLTYANPSITDFIYLIKSIGIESLANLDILGGSGLSDRLKKHFSTPAVKQNLTLRGSNEPHKTILQRLEGTLPAQPAKKEVNQTTETNVTEEVKNELSFDEKIKQGLNAMRGPTRGGGLPYIKPSDMSKTIFDEKNKIVRILITDPSQNNSSYTISLKLDDNSAKFGSIPSQYVKIGNKEFVWTGEKFVSYYQENYHLSNTSNFPNTKTTLSQFQGQGGYARLKYDNIAGIKRRTEQEIENHNNPLEKIDDINRSPSLKQTMIIPDDTRTKGDGVREVGKNKSYRTDPTLRGVSSLGIGIDISKTPTIYKQISIDGKNYTPITVTLRHIASNQTINNKDAELTTTLLMAPNGDILQGQNLQYKTIVQSGGHGQERNPSPDDLAQYGQIRTDENTLIALVPSGDGKTLARKKQKS
ncbi:MAG: hypothetical protein NZL83_00990 [Candidatus Absconditabacterales bacterium]|nr:hypothetical protein [Candidatus Absconditabacterales bacterium]